MTDIKMLREAARLMRERAEKATRGPWVVLVSDGLVWTQQPIPGDPVSGSTEPEDAVHIASWHPAVALAIADWLDAAAEREQEHRDRTSGRGYAYADPSEGDEVHGALIVARAYLGPDETAAGAPVPAPADGADTACDSRAGNAAPAPAPPSFRGGAGVTPQPGRERRGR